ncbi:MAG: pyridoxal phosphate-dependent aminotransferase [Solirubrobacteraceae bacterium]
MTEWRSLMRGPLLNLGPYVPGVSAEEMRRRYGLAEVIRLNWNEGLFGPLPGVLDEVAEGLDDTWAYPEAAYRELRERLATWLGADVEQIVPGHGIQALLLMLLDVFLEPGDRVVIPHPTYGLYAQACRAAGAEVELVQCPELALDLERIANAARRTHARLVFICDPNNPTGLTLARSDWEAFLDALPDGSVVIADEAYGEYIPTGDRVDRLADIAAGRPVVVLRTFSKIFGLAGLRLGYAILDTELTPYANAVQVPFNVNHAALVAGCASLAQAPLVGERRELTRECRALLSSRLRAGGLRPLASDANFVLTELGADDRVVAEGLASRGLLIRPGSEFGLPGYARITVGPAELMERAASDLLRECASAGAAGSEPRHEADIPRPAQLRS